MNQNHALAIAYVAYKQQLAAAAKYLEDNFRPPLENWLDRFADRQVEVDDAVKLFRPKVEAKEEQIIPDGPAIEQGFEDLVRKGAFNVAELQNLVETGALVVGDLNLMLPVVAKKLKVKPSKLETKMDATPAGFRNEFRTGVLAKGKFEGLAEQVTKAVDIQGAMEAELKRITGGLPAAPAPGQAALNAKPV